MNRTPKERLGLLRAAASVDPAAWASLIEVAEAAADFVRSDEGGIALRRELAIGSSDIGPIGRLMIALATLPYREEPS
jgi:hypothetical protein